MSFFLLRPQSGRMTIRGRNPHAGMGGGGSLNLTARSRTHAKTFHNARFLNQEIYKNLKACFMTSDRFQARSLNCEKGQLASSHLSARPSVRMEQLGSHWTDFREKLIPVFIVAPSISLNYLIIN